MRRGVEASHSIEMRPFRRSEAGKEHTIPSFRDSSVTHPPSPAQQAHSLPGPAGHHDQAREIASGRYKNECGPRNDGGGFLSIVTSEGRYRSQ